MEHKSETKALLFMIAIPLLILFFALYDFDTGSISQSEAKKHCRESISEDIDNVDFNFLGTSFNSKGDTGYLKQPITVQDNFGDSIEVTYQCTVQRASSGEIEAQAEIDVASLTKEIVNKVKDLLELP